MEAFSSFFKITPKKAQPKYFGLVGDILNILPPIKESQDSDDLSNALLALVGLAEVSPKMFKSMFSNLVQFSISVVQDKELDDVCRQSALELMATFADYAPSMCRKDPSYTNDMITQCLSLMTDLGDDDDDAEEWLALDDVSFSPFLRFHLKHPDSLRSFSRNKMRAIRTTSLASRRWTDSPTDLVGKLSLAQPSTGSRA